MAILAWLLGALIVFFSLLFALFRDDYLRQFSTPSAFNLAGAIFALLLCYELAVRHAIGRWLRQGRSVPSALRYLNAFVETSVPSILILVVSRAVDPVYVLQSASSLLYGVFIVLSTLRLDFRLSVFTGMVAAVEYALLSYAYLGAGGEAVAGTPLEMPPFYLGKGAMLLLAGLAAGFVAHQLRRRVGNAFRAQQERQRIVNAFGQQVSPAIVDELLKSGREIESRRATVCVLFMDVRDFTPLVESKTPEEIVAFQNAVFGEAIAAVNRNHGIINQFLGDGFMATFGAPLSTGRECRDALVAARELLAAIKLLSDAGRIPPISVGIGLHTGEAVTGNIGSEERKQYSITGNVVILAARIEQLNKQFGSQLLASREVLASAGEDIAAYAALGPVPIKGRNEPIELFRVA